VNGPMFPKPYGPRHVGGGEDIFEESVENNLGASVFVDDWAMYHMYEGETHCGSLVTRHPPTTKPWWETW
jgi:hypothetical protein